MRLVDELADDLVVEVFDGDPVDPLLPVLLLLLLQDQLNEQLLQLLVAVVDAKLLKAVFVEHLKPVNVEDPDHRRRTVDAVTHTLSRKVAIREVICIV